MFKANGQELRKIIEASAHGATPNESGVEQPSAKPKMDTSEGSCEQRPRKRNNSLENTQIMDNRIAPYPLKFDTQP
jgi:hypothetical protein